MKFGKALETNAVTLPEEWRPYVIQYKALKKKINAIVKELDDRGLPSPIIKNLLAQSMSGDMQRLEYTFDEDKKHLRTSIKVVIDAPESGTEELGAFGPAPPSQEEHLSKLFAHELNFLNTSASSSSSDLQEQLSLNDAEESHGGLEDLLDNTTTKALSMALAVDLSEEDEERQSNATTPDGPTPTTSSCSSTISSPPLSPAADMPIGTAAAGESSAWNMKHIDNHPPSLANNVTTHRPNSGTSSTRPSPQLSAASPLATTARPHTPSPLSRPPLHPGSTLSLDSLASSKAPAPSRQESSSSLASASSASSASSSEPMDTLITPGAEHERQTAAQSKQGTTTVLTTEEDGKRVLVIELTADTAFFDQLGEEISQLSKLQQANKHEFESKVEDLSKMLTVVSSPHNKDMYTWREILKVYLDAQVFVGDHEADRSTRSSEKAQKQLRWFLTEMDRSKLVHKFKQAKSKVAFNTFFQLNSELVTMKQFRELNQMAMTKILKKHDKRTNLTASAGFPKHLQNEPFYNDNISKSLTYTIGNQLLSIIPQPDDYACPICMSVAWKPIRLRCKHVFCVRCLIKAQRKKMIHCPVCRESNSVMDADASNLDVSMMNFLKLYFPKEIKEKRKESSREQAAEEMEAFTGQRWSEVPEQACIIM
ncbi:hypothetical protein EDD11_004240 [Mortierella claussenii]|nr:hypothetical protein EDD11_004240 [Mortierella claussenii]